MKKSSKAVDQLLTVSQIILEAEEMTKPSVIKKYTQAISRIEKVKTLLEELLKEINSTAD